MIRFNILLYSLVFSFYAIGLRGQNKVEDGINNSFMFCRDYPMERVYLHFDNTSYYLGEKIRYKGYIVVLDSATSLSISKVLHVELLNQFGQLLDKQNVRIENGAACGDFDLAPQNLPGYYEVRAYTRWMMNFGENNYFSRVFPCYAAAEPPGEFKKELFKYRLDISMKMRPSTSDDKMDIRFYPEGGQLVTDIPSTVAFQITSPKDVSPQIGRVDIYSSANLLIDTCRVVHNGMGRFRYCPSDKPGYISFVYKDKKYKYDLLDATPRGVCLSVSRLSDDSVTVSIFKNTGQTDTLGVCLTSGGIIYKAAEVVSDDSRIQLKFPLEQLPCGVAQVLLLDGEDQPCLD